MTEAAPFLRWPGGKRRLVGAITNEMPQQYSRYYEPFAGSAAVFFRLKPAAGVLGDLSKELIETYIAVRNDVDSVIEWLRGRAQDETTYYQVRSMKPRSEAGKAGRFIYLNRLAFNGIWRVNRQGDFNVPYGYRPRKDLLGAAQLRAAARVLSKADLRRGDFAQTLKGVRSGALVYADPPYTLAHENNGFRKYNDVLFSWEDQIRLAELAQILAERGAHVCVSNAKHPTLSELYRDFRPITLDNRVTIAASSSSRLICQESLFVSW